ncbi:MAG TPA: agmatine deiminase family protein [Ignavibacteriaceae bacterium]|nr:agmatine deiminase family protein [Ignavibacteriaceae bacterium]
MNYRLPAEWEKHRGTIVAWPHNREDWPGKFHPIPWVYVEIVRKLSIDEKVFIIVNSKQSENRIRKMLSKAGVNLKQIKIFKLTTNRGWMRDSCPAFVKNENSEVEAIKFRFNGWAKYDNWKKDAKLPAFITEKLGYKLSEAVWNDGPVVLEGGAIDSNGAGTLLTTEECLMDENVQVRNPGFTKKDYEEMFNQYLGITNVIWLGKGIAGDDTHGHVDDLCRFVNKNTVVMCREKNPKDENYFNLEENWERIKDAKLEDGSAVQAVELPMPEPLIFEKMRLPASYANFYIGNGVVLVPTFNDKNDGTALGILTELFPDKVVTGIHAVDLVWGLGTIHCLTHEVVE